MNENQERIMDAISTWEAICDYEYQADRFENDDLDQLREIMLAAENYNAIFPAVQAQLDEAVELLGDYVKCIDPSIRPADWHDRFSAFLDKVKA